MRFFVRLPWWLAIPVILIWLAVILAYAFLVIILKIIWLVADSVFAPTKPPSRV